VTSSTLPSGPLDPSHLIKGGWQLAGGHGSVDESAAIADMFAYAESGITTFDCADIYTGVEAMIGRFLREWRAQKGADAPSIRVHTKCVPDLDLLPTLTRADLERTIDRSLRRLGVEQLDLVQFHWWDYAVGDPVQAALHLDAMRREGKIAALAVTNTDLPHLRAIVDAGVPITAHQLQCSLLDRRALGPMRDYCVQQGIKLYSYGSLAGGFLHERWLGADAPSEPLENRSLVKYKLIIDEWGGWEPFQSLLRALEAVATRHQTTIGAVALRWVLDQPGISAAIVGSRNVKHLPGTLAALSVEMTDAERSELSAALGAGPGPRGDVYALERDKAGRHAVIMRYGLNAMATD
jgi:aryl-alcohol dehydrogenase-like predicted oxidoreductase